jgi:glycosyltransferase involved in cell wall biosynthesis
VRVVVVTEQRFVRGPDGRVHVSHTFTTGFWRYYLAAFAAVRVVARVRVVSKVPAGYAVADGEGIEFHEIPDYHGPLQYIRRFRAVRSATMAAVRSEDAVILRVGSELANIIFPRLLRQGHPYAVEVVGDPWDVFARGSIAHPLRPLFRRWFYWNLRFQCQNASAAAYVTKRTLQARYPVRSVIPTTHYSSVDLRPSAVASVSTSDVLLDDRLFAAESREVSFMGPWRLVMVGSLEQPYKGVDVALRALQRVRRHGLHVDLVVIGEGRMRPRLEKLCAALGLRGAVSFRGSLPREEVFAELRRSDVFLIPSRTEGLPRALIEAMALGLPALGSRVGGIPELLEPDELIRSGDFAQLASLIETVLRDPRLRQVMSERNRLKAEEFKESVLRGRRIGFYQHVRQITEEWLEARRG